MAIRIIPARDMILARAKEKAKATDVGTVADRPMGQSTVHLKALTTKRPKIDMAKPQKLGPIMRQDQIADQEPDAVKVAAMAPVTVAGGKPTHKRRSPIETNRL